MERTWLETVQSLGLDVQLAIILLLLAIDGAGSLLRGLAARWAARRDRAPGALVRAPRMRAVRRWHWPAAGLRPGDRPTH